MNFFLIAVMLVLTMNGCWGCAVVTPKSSTPAGTAAAAPAANQPVNQFEANAYKTLMDAQAGLTKASQDFQAGTLPASVKPDLNRAIAVYNTAQSVLHNYDTAARAGGDVTALQTEVEQDLAQLLVLVANLKATK